MKSFGLQHHLTHRKETKFSERIMFLEACNPQWHFHNFCVWCHLLCEDKKQERQLLHEVSLRNAFFLGKIRR